MQTRTLAVIPTIPGREAALAVALASLRPQVTELRVLCHDMTEPPECVREYATGWVCEPDRHGSAAKLRWAREWDGLYLGCDDDLHYPDDYVRVMHGWVRRWRGRALCAIGGWRFTGHETQYPDGPGVQQLGYPIGGNRGEWVNYPIAAGLAFDTRLMVPSIIPEKNQEEAYLALWAQRHRVPMWLVPKAKGWLRWLLPRENPGYTIWAAERADGYAIRKRLAEEPARNGWKLFTALRQWPPAEEPFAS